MALGCRRSTLFRLGTFPTFNPLSADSWRPLSVCLKFDLGQPIIPVSLSLLVKFIRRILNRRYKGRNHTYIRYVLEVPARFNRKVASYSGMCFKIQITSSETPTQEVLTIALIRDRQHKDSTPATWLSVRFPWKKSPRKMLLLVKKVYQTLEIYLP